MPLCPTRFNVYEHLRKNFDSKIYLQSVKLFKSNQTGSMLQRNRRDSDHISNFTYNKFDFIGCTHESRTQSQSCLEDTSAEADYQGPYTRELFDADK